MLARRTIALLSIHRRRWPVARPENLSSRSAQRVGVVEMRQQRGEKRCRLSDDGSNQERDVDRFGYFSWVVNCDFYMNEKILF